MPSDRLNRSELARNPNKNLPPGISADMVRHQLGRLCASPQFRTSRRCVTFLEYVVERAANGHPEPLKERTIGVEVFGRSLDYDTNHDPVVRGTASEIRKRLAQYYQTPGREFDLRVDLSAGSYIPEFHPPPSQASTGRDSAPPDVEIPIGAPLTPLFVQRRPPLSRSKWLALPVLLAALVAAALAASLLLKPASVLDQFWAPVLQSRHPVLLCLGQPTVYNLLGSTNVEVEKKYGHSPANQKIIADLKDIVPNSDRYLALGDAICLSRIASFLGRKGRDFNVRGGGSTSFADLRENTAILLGGFTNDWTMRLTGQLRFTFETSADQNTHFVRDRLHPNNHNWELKDVWPAWKMPVDYAIVSRVLDPNTDKVVITAAGITQYGTAAAGEFLTNPEYLALALKHAPRDWEQRNMQVVLATKVIGNTAGPPEVLATEFQ